MKLFLDDVRQTPIGWQRAETAWETIRFLEHEDVTHLSLDHDLGDSEHPGNGNDVAKWIEKQAVNDNPKNMK